MFTIDNLHIVSLIIALFFSITIHVSFLGIGKNLINSALIIILLPFFLMGGSLIFPQIFISSFSYILYFGGLALFLKQFPFFITVPLNIFKNYSNNEKWFFAFTFLYLFSFFMSSTFIDSHGLIQDSLVYHLQGPKEWALYLNGAKFNPNNPIVYTTSYYEYLYYYFFLILKPIFTYSASLPNTSFEFSIYTMLLIAQVFSSLIAYVYIPIMITRLSSPLGIYRFLPIFFVFGIRMITWTWPLSKNDIYPFLCYLTAVLIFYTHYIMNQNNLKIFPLLLSFFLIGVGTAAKLTNAHVVLISLLFLLVFYRSLLNSLFQKYGLIKITSLTALAIILGCSLFLLRNFLETGNPFYPTAKFGFPNIYLSDYADRPELYSEPAGLANAVHKFTDFFKTQFTLTLLLIFGLFLNVRKISLLIFFSFGLMSSLTGTMYYYRMTNSLLILISLFFILFFIEFRSKYKLKHKEIFLSVFVIAFSYFQIEKIIKIPKKYYFEPIHHVLERSVEYWPTILNDNITHYSDPNYVFSPQKEIFPFFSRFPFISQYDTVEMYRFDYNKVKYDKN